LRGHFEGFPVVAGVVQLRWVSLALRAWRGSTPHAEVIEALKFPEPLLPGQSVSLEVEVAAQADCFRFRVWDDGRTFASGRLRARVSS
jgi:3-hydroxymyristoyl/3-hydroxydecanoyl-(acyl carrier protein) dehydratase